MAWRAFAGVGAALAALAIVPGCGETTAKTEFELENTTGRMRQGTYDFQSREAMRAGAAQISEGFFVAPVDTRVRAADLLPPRLERVDAVSIVSREPLGLVDIAARLSRITGVPHVVALGPTGARVTATDDGSVSSQSTGDDDETGNDAGQATNISGGGASTRAGTLRIRPNLTGSLSEVLDEISDAFEVEWSVGDDRIIFRDYVTRQYQLSSLPTRSSLSLSTGSVAIDIWSEVTSTLSNLVGQGTRITIGEGTGIITVTALLSDQDRIQDYLSTMNDALGQQIAFDVTVLNVTLTDEEGFNFDLQELLLQGTNWDAGFKAAGSLAQAAPIGTANVAIAGDDYSVTAAVQALSTQNNVSVETRTGATTTNFQVVPIEVVQDEAYVESVETVANSTGDIAGTSINPGTITTGFTMALAPRILNTREILVRYELELSDVIQIENFTSNEGTDNETTVQLPEVSRVNFEQQVVLRNGQTLVLFGFERRRAVLDKQGIGNANFFVFGGSRGASIERAASIVFITPRLLQRISGGG